MFWFQFLVYLLLLINIFAITVLKNHRWYGYARYKVCPLLCDTYLESAHYNFPVIFKYMPISTWLNRKSSWKVKMVNTSIWISFRVISNGKFRNCFIFCTIPYSRKVRETNIWNPICNWSSNKTVFNYSNILDSDIALMLGSSFTKNARKRFIRSA